MVRGHTIVIGLRQECSIQSRQRVQTAANWWWDEKINSNLTFYDIKCVIQQIFNDFFLFEDEGNFS